MTRCQIVTVLLLLTLIGGMVFSFRPATIRWNGLTDHTLFRTTKPPPFRSTTTAFSFFNDNNRQQRYSRRLTRHHLIQQRRWYGDGRGLSIPFSSQSLNESDDVDGITNWTVEQAIKYSIHKLEKGGVIEPNLSVRHLLASSLDLSWETGFRDIIDDRSKLQQQCLTSEQAQDFTMKLQRRMNHEPIQYILGQWDFLDYTITIRPPLLCPRPETEELVERVVAEMTTNISSSIRILDVGCGTGVIGLSLAKRIPSATVVAIDVEPVAIATSLENVGRILGADPVEANRYAATLVSAADFSPVDPVFDLVVSNPPYIPRADMATLSTDVVRYESEDALCGGEDGLDVVRTIIHQLPNWCRSGAICWMEVDPSHPTLIRDWLDSNPDLGVQFESTFKDMFGKDRFVKISVK
jgi:release factor glutamine methyltransferase